MNQRGAQRRPALVDRFRLESRSTWIRQPVHEWHHFIVFLERGTLLVNFSREVRVDGRVLGRVIVLYHEGSWSHGLVSTEDARFSPDGLHLRIEGHRLDIDDEGWSVRTATPDGQVEAALRFTAATPPLVARNRGIAGDGNLHWVMYPAVTVSGSIRVGRQIREIDRVSGYHDHNWGQFAWGDDFGWEWGIISQPAGGDTSLVCSALTNRTRSVTRIQQLFLWAGGAHVWTARGPEIRRRAGGQWPTLRVPRLPAILSVATPLSASVAPRELEFTAEDGPRRVDVQVSLSARAQILIPDDIEPCSTVVLNECVGRSRVRHTLNGEVQYEGESPCVFEILEGGGHVG